MTYVCWLWLLQYTLCTISYVILFPMLAGCRARVTALKNVIHYICYVPFQTKVEIHTHTGQYKVDIISCILKSVSDTIDTFPAVGFQVAHNQERIKY